MASKITLFKAFTLGPTGDPRNFFVFPVELEDNATDIENAVNALVDEVNSIAGNTGVTFIPDLLFPDVVIAVTSGRVGAGSFVVSAAAAGSITISAGVAAVGGIRVQNQTSSSVTPAGLTNGTDRVIYIDSTGAVVAADADPGGVLVLYEVDVTGGNFDTGTIEQVAPTFQDGDEWVRLRTAPATSLFPDSDDEYENATTPRYLAPSRRVDNLELVLSGRSTNPDLATPALPPIRVPGGSAGSPGLAFADGSGTQDDDTGLYRAGANVLGVATNGTQAARWNASQQAVSATQGRFRAAASAESHGSSGSWVAIGVDNAHVDYDVGNFHAGGSPSTPTVPGTDFAGNYSLKGFVRFAANATGQRGLRVTAGGTIVAEAVVDAAASGVTSLSIAADTDLANAETVVFEVFQDSGGALNYDYGASFRLEC